MATFRMCQCQDRGKVLKSFYINVINEDARALKDDLENLNT